MGTTLKRIRLLSLIMVLVSILVACGGAPTAAPTTANAPTAAPAPTAVPAPTPVPAPTTMPTDMAMAATAAPTVAPTVASATAGYPVTIENCGKTLTFNKPPTHAITLNQPATEFLLALDLQDRMVGTAYLDNPIPDAYKAAYDSIPVLAKQYPSQEVIVAAQPDFVYASFGAFSPSSVGERDRYQSVGINTYVDSTSCKKSVVTVDDVYTEITTLGKIFGVTDRADALIVKIKGEINEVAGSLPATHTDHPKRVYFYAEGEATPSAYGGANLVTDLVRRAGGINIFADVAEGYPQVSWETIAQRDPEVIVITDYFAGPPVDTSRAFIRGYPVAAAITAVRTNTFPALQQTYLAASPRIGEAIRQLAQALYPDAFPNTSIASYPVTIENCGKTLTFTKAPERVTTLYPPTTEMMLQLGLGKLIVGAGAVNDAPPLPELAAAYQALPVLTKTGGAPKEVLINARPDFVFDNQPDYFYDAKQGFATQDDLKAAGAQIYTMSAKCGGGKLNATIDDVYTDLRNLGKIFGVSAKAAATIAEMQQRIAAVQAKIKGLAPVSVMFYDAGEAPLSIYGPGTWEYVLNLAGGTNIFKDLKESYAQVSVEQVASRNADVFIVAGYTADGVKTPDERVAYLKATFPNASAVKNNHVVIIPYQYTNPGIQNALGVEALAKALHPEAFK